MSKFHVLKANTPVGANDFRCVKWTPFFGQKTGDSSPHFSRFARAMASGCPCVSGQRPVSPGGRVKRRSALLASIRPRDNPADGTPMACRPCLLREQVVSPPSDTGAMPLKTHGHRSATSDPLDRLRPVCGSPAPGAAVPGCRTQSTGSVPPAKPPPFRDVTNTVPRI